jgi:hypothetical protein
MSRVRLRGTRRLRKRPLRYDPPGVTGTQRGRGSCRESVPASPKAPPVARPGTVLDSSVMVRPLRPSVKDEASSTGRTPAALDALSTARESVRRIKPLTPPRLGQDGSPAVGRPRASGSPGLPRSETSARGSALGETVNVPLVAPAMSCQLPPLKRAHEGLPSGQNAPSRDWIRGARPWSIRARAPGNSDCAPTGSGDARRRSRRARP